MDERIIGRKAICVAFEALFGISTWMGVRKCIRRDKLPVRYTPGGKPFFIKSELLEYEQRLRNIG